MYECAHTVFKHKLLTNKKSKGILHGMGWFLKGEYHSARALEPAINPAHIRHRLRNPNPDDIDGNKMKEYNSAVIFKNLYLEFLAPFNVS